MTREAFLERLSRLGVGHDGRGHRAPHKPLLLLWALGRFQATGSSEADFTSSEDRLNALITEFGPPARSSRRAQMPFWHLVTDGVWELLPQGDEPLGPDRAALRRAKAVGRLPEAVEGLLQSDPGAIPAAAQLLLTRHFTDALAPLVISAVGLDLSWGDVPGATVTMLRRRRDPAWRADVLHAWGHACAMCGYDGRIGTVPAALEAAHVRWHSQGGPDDLDNGLALCALHHALLDLGVLGLSADGYISVSGAFTGREPSTHATVYALAGRPLREPLPGRPGPAASHVAWHAAEVFKGGAIAVG